MELSDAQIRERDGYRCARCGRADCGGVLDVHHRVRRSQLGGQSPANRVTLGRGCHDWAHFTDPAAAKTAGWLLPSGTDPAAVPVRHFLWPAGPVLLTADGGFAIWDDGGLR